MTTRARSSAASSRQPRSTPWSTRARGRLDRPQPRRPTRTTSSADERPGRVRKATRPQGRLKSSALYYGAEADDPALFAEAMDRPHAPSTPIERASSTPSAPCASWPAPPARHDHRAALANGLGPALRTWLGQLSACLPCPGSSASTRASVRPRAIWRAASSARSATAWRASTTAPPTACSSSARWQGCSASRWRPCCRPSGPRWPRAPCVARAASRPRPSACCATARPGRPQAQGDRLPLRYTSREAMISCASSSAWRPSSATAGTPTREREPRSSCAAARACGRPPGGRSPPRRPRSRPAPSGRPRPGPTGYDELGAKELVALLPSLEPEALAELADRERSHAARPEA